MLRQTFYDRGAAGLGEFVLLGCITRDASGTPTVPDACPTMKIYDGTGTLVVTQQIPVQAKFRTTGRFAWRQFLDSTFAAGRYWATYDYTLSSGSYTGSSLDTFEVLPGGDANGQFLSLYHFRRPVGRLVIGQLDAQKLFLARNPYV